jgi:hypothetical protein
MDFLRTLKKRKPKQHVPVRVGTASTASGGPEQRVAVQEPSAKKLQKAG